MTIEQVKYALKSSLMDGPTVTLTEDKFFSYDL